MLPVAGQTAGQIGLKFFVDFIQVKKVQLSFWIIFVRELQVVYNVSSIVGNSLYIYRYGVMYVWL